jgi:molybdate transport system substrate-binding protein
MEAGHLNFWGARIIYSLLLTPHSLATFGDIFMKHIFRLIFIPIIFLAGCAGTSQPDPLTVFAAASLTEAFTEMATAFEMENPETEVQLNFAGSQTLRLQIEQGAQADVFASANQLHTEALQDAQLIDKPVTFTHNQLVVIMPVENPASIETLDDLAKPGLKLILAGAAVPAGRYARQVLENLNTHPNLQPDFSQHVLQNLVSEEDTVKGVVAKVQLGEADAGIVYASDLTPAVVDDIITLPLPPKYNVIADYPIAILANTKQPNLAQAFIEFVLSPQGQTILANHGFQPLQE